MVTEVVVEELGVGAAVGGAVGVADGTADGASLGDAVGARRSQKPHRPFHAASTVQKRHG